MERTYTVDIPDFDNRVEVMRLLERRGIVQEREYDGNVWSWEILQPERLPKMSWLVANLITNNGIIVL